MKLYYFNYLDWDGPRRKWFTSMRKAVRCRTWLRKNSEEYGVEQIFKTIYKAEITPTLKGILQFLNDYCGRH